MLSDCCQRMGDVCAVKVFADLVRTVHIQIKARELELMRKLKHRNVVCLLAIEQEVFSIMHHASLLFAVVNL